MKPILFNTEMVQAIIDGRKTQTRRVIKEIPNHMHCGKRIMDWGLSSVGEFENGVLDFEEQTDVDDSWSSRAVPQYQIGDVLYVRETFCKLHALEDDLVTQAGEDKYYYAADGYNPTPFNTFPDADGFSGYRDHPKWTPSIHMPKEAARIFLKVTDIRVERLQDINGQGRHDDFLKEGITVETNNSGLMYKAKFIKLWNNTVKNQDYSWDANPWVWVYEFEKCEGETI